MAMFEDKFKAATLGWLNGKLIGSVAIKIDSVEDDTYNVYDSFGFDRTDYDVTVYYIDSDGARKHYYYSGKFSSFLDELLSVEVD